MSAQPRFPDLPTVKVSTRFELDAGPARHRIGLIALDSDVATERDFHTMLPPDAMFYTSRVRCTNPVTVENLRRQGPLLRDAVKLLIPGQRLDVIAYSCTSGTVAIGYEGVASEIRAAERPGIPVVTPITSALAGFAHLGIRTISLLTPYLDSVNQAMRAFIESHGVKVVNVGGFCMEDDREMARIPADAILDAALEVSDERADALFISCTAIRAAEIIERAEAALSRPVLSANQTLIWQSLREAGYPAPVRGFGRQRFHRKGQARYRTWRGEARLPGRDALARCDAAGLVDQRVTYRELIATNGLPSATRSNSAKVSRGTSGSEPSAG